MKKVKGLISLLLPLFLLCGCSAAQYPGSDEVRALIPDTLTVDFDAHIEILETPRTLDALLRDVPRTFYPDETVWQESFSEGGTQFYKRINDADGSDYICIYDRDITTVHIGDTELMYEDGALVSADLENINIYLEEDSWSLSEKRDDFLYFTEYDHNNTLLYATVSQYDGGIAFFYCDGIISQLEYRVSRETDDGSENFYAQYTPDGALDCIYYYGYCDFPFERTVETVYDSNYLSEDAPVSRATAAPAATPAPTEAETPSATPAPSAPRSGFFGKVLDEIEKDFNNIKEDIVKDFQ